MRIALSVVACAKLNLWCFKVLPTNGSASTKSLASLFLDGPVVHAAGVYLRLEGTAVTACPSHIGSCIFADGKPENAFAFSGEAKNKRYAHEIVLECHEAWKRLINGEAQTKDVKVENVTVEGSAAKTSAPPIPKDQALPDAPIDSSIDKRCVKAHLHPNMHIDFVACPYSFFISPHANF